MRAGELRHYCRVDTPTAVADAIGAGGAVTWATYAYVWAAIWPISARERIRSDKTEMVSSHRVRIRYISGIQPKMRIVYGARVLEIIGVINGDERNIFLDLLCNEVV